MTDKADLIDSNSDASVNVSIGDRSSSMRARLSRSLDGILRTLSTPLGCLLGTLLVTLLGGLFVHTRVYAMTGGLLAMILVGLFWPWFSVWSTRGGLTFVDTRAREGQPTTLRITLHNRPILSVHGLQVVWQNAEPGQSNEIESIATLARLPGRKSIVLDHPFTPSRRGEYPLGEAYVTCRLPFDLWTARRRLTVERKLLVWPATHVVGPIPEGAGRSEQAALSLRDRAGTQGDFLGVRPYRRGDSLRRVHWGQTARYDRLIVCEVEAATIPAVRVTLDVNVSTYPGPEGDACFENAVREAASLCEQWLLDGATVELVAGPLLVPARAGRRQLTTIMDALARVRRSVWVKTKRFVSEDMFEVLVTSGSFSPTGIKRSKGRCLCIRVASENGEIDFQATGLPRDGFSSTNLSLSDTVVSQAGRFSC